MVNRGRDPRNQNRGRKPLSEGRRTAAKLLQKSLGKKTAELQLFVFGELLGMDPGKKRKLEKMLQNKRVLAKNGTLKDLERIVARAVQLSADLRSEATTGEAKPGLSGKERGFLVITINVALSTIMEAKQKRII